MSKKSKKDGETTPFVELYKIKRLITGGSLFTLAFFHVLNTIDQSIKFEEAFALVSYTNMTISVAFSMYVFAFYLGSKTNHAENDYFSEKELSLIKFWIPILFAIDSAVFLSFFLTQ